MKVIVTAIPQTSSLGNFVASWEYDLSNTNTNSLTFKDVKQTGDSSTNFSHIVVIGQNKN